MPETGKVKTDSQIISMSHTLSLLEDETPWGEGGRGFKYPGSNDAKMEMRRLNKEEALRSRPFPNPIGGYVHPTAYSSNAFPAPHHAHTFEPDHTTYRERAGVSSGVLPYDENFADASKTFPTRDPFVNLEAIASRDPVAIYAKDYRTRPSSNMKESLSRCRENIAKVRSNRGPARG